MAYIVAHRFTMWSHTVIWRAVGKIVLVSKAVLLLWIYYVFFLSCVCYAFVCVYLYVPCGHLLESSCEFVTFPLVSWVRCGTLLYRFLIFAPLLTLNQKSTFLFMQHSRTVQTQIQMWRLIRVCTVCWEDVCYISIWIKIIKIPPNNLSNWHG